MSERPSSCPALSVVRWSFVKLRDNLDQTLDVFVELGSYGPEEGESLSHLWEYGFLLGRLAL